MIAPAIIARNFSFRDFVGVAQDRSLRWSSASGGETPTTYDFDNGPVAGHSVDDHGRQLLAALALTDPDAVSDMLFKFYRSTIWGHYGCPTFNLTHGLTAALLLTDCSGVKAGEFLRLPFPAFVVLVPKGFLRMDAVGGGVLDVEWIHVMGYTRAPDVSDLRRKYLSGLQYWNAGAAALLYRNEAMRRTLEEEAKGPLQMGLSVSLYGGGIDYHVQNEIGAEDDVERFLEILGKNERDDVFSIPSTTTDQQNFSAAMRIVVNAILYVHECRAAGERGHQRMELTSKGEPKVWALGREVKLPPEIRRAAVESITMGRSAGWRLIERVAVRGHWRNQPIGVGREGRKRIWISPYFKGQDDPVTTTLRSYSVDERR